MAVTAHATPLALDRLLGAVPPASGAIVMGTGIVSVALSLDGRETLSRILLAVAAAIWLALGVLLPARAVRDRARLHRDARAPATFAAVAGTAVLGTRLTMVGWAWAGIAALIVALALWLALLEPVLGHWRTPTVGASFVLTVGTESLALLAATLALEQRATWLLVASLAPFALGLGFYVLVVCRFDVRQLATGRGDHWVTGGALAISTVAAARITAVAQQLGALSGAVAVLKGISATLWTLAILWLPLLLVAEARWPRGGYDLHRWSTVFPVGMYAACSLMAGGVLSAPAITRFGRVWVWVAVAVWAVVACGLGRALVTRLRRRRSPAPAPASRRPPAA